LKPVSIEELMAGVALPDRPRKVYRKTPNRLQVVKDEVVETGDVSVVRLRNGDEVAASETWPRPIDLFAHTRCLVEDEVGQVFGGRWLQPSAHDRSLKTLARAVGTAAREAFGAEHVRLVGPRRAARMLYKMQREVGR
jgi:hypothetical protein